MIHVVTGVGADGRSTIISKEEKVLVPASESDFEVDDTAVRDNADHGPQPGVAKLADVADPIPRVERPPTEPLLPVPLPPGGHLWLHLEFGPTEYDFHRTDSIDYALILGGEVELILENGSVLLHAGDTAVIPGVLHRWRSATGWTQSSFMVGLDPARSG